MNRKYPRERSSQKATVVIVALVLLFTLSLSLIPKSPTSAATPTPTVKGKKCKYYHKVQPGDNIIYIGQLYQYDWRLIAEANRLKEPYVLTPGEKLCIPGGERPTIVDSETGEGKTVTAQADPTGLVGGLFDRVYIKLEHFPKNKVYNVRIQPKGSFVFYRLESIRTNDKGFFEGWLRIPKYIPPAPLNELCIKDVWTDETACTRFDNPAFFAEETKPWKTHKYGH